MAISEATTNSNERAVRGESTAAGSPDSSAPFVLDRAERHGEWQHRAFVDAINEHRWATVLGLRTFIRYDDVALLLKDNRRLREPGLDWLAASGITDGPLFDWWRLIMFTNEGDVHRGLRALVNKAFAAHGVESMRSVVDGIVSEYGDKLSERSELDFVADFAHWIPVRTICRFLGIPEEDVAVFERWSSDLGKVFSLTITEETRRLLERAIVDLSTYVKRIIAERRRHPESDLVTALIAARDQGERLSEEELVAMVANIILGGHDTTKLAIANSLLALLSHPGEWATLCDDPSRAPAAVEEALRLNSSVVWTSRVVTVPFALDDVSFDEGERIFLRPLAANHDPREFPDPEVLDISRRGTEPITFGFGPHFCIGAALARMETQAVIRMLATRFRSIERVDEAIEWTPLLEFRGPVAFRVRVPEQHRTRAGSL
jgi:cytochrome P450